MGKMLEYTVEVIEYWLEGLFPLFFILVVIGLIVGIVLLGKAYPIAFLSIMIVVIAPIVLGAIMRGSDRNE